MAFSLPNFNLLADKWNAGHTPAGDPADYTDLPCQVYVHTKADIDQAQGDASSWTPPIYFRMPNLSPVFDRDAILTETTVGTGYYKVRWIQTVHVGFTNQYLVVLVEQCNSDGTTPRTY